MSCKWPYKLGDIVVYNYYETDEYSTRGHITEITDLAIWSKRPNRMYPDERGTFGLPDRYCFGTDLHTILRKIFDYG